MEQIASKRFEPTQAERDFVAAVKAGRPYRPGTDGNGTSPVPKHPGAASAGADASLRPFWPWLRSRMPGGAPSGTKAESEGEAALAGHEGEIRADLIRAMIICDSARRKGLQPPSAEAALVAEYGEGGEIEISPRGIEIDPFLNAEKVPAVDPAMFGNIQDEASLAKRIKQETEWRQAHQASGRIRILGHLDLRGIDFPKNIVINGCDFLTEENEPAAIGINGAKLGGLSLDDSSFALLAGSKATIHGDFSANQAQSGSIILRGVELSGGLFLSGARLTATSGNALSLNSGRVGGNVFLRDGFVSHGEINLIGAHIAGVLDCTDGDFSATERPAINGYSAHISGSVSMTGAFRATASVDFSNARLSAPLNCVGARIELSKGQSFRFNGASISGNASFMKLRVTGGELNFDSANIDGKLMLSGALLENEGGTALGCNGTKIRDSVFLREQFVAKGLCDFIAAEIGGRLDCRGGSIIRPGATALCCNGIRIRGAVFLAEKFTAEGEVDFTGAHIGDMLDCSEGEFTNPDRDALDCSGATIDGSVFLCRHFKAIGAVTFNAARIGGMLRCDRGSFSNEGGNALDCFAAVFGSSVNLDYGFDAVGRVGFVEATISGVLDCSSGEFDGRGGTALDCADSTIGHNVILCARFSAKGQVNFSGATIGGNFQLWTGCITRSEAKSIALNLYTTRIERHLQLDSPRAGEGVCRIVGDVDLRQASCSTLDDQTGDNCDWLEGHLQLDGFTYKTLGDQSSKKWKTRRIWLLLQPSDHTAGKNFKPQPFEQLERVLRRMGHTNSARRIGAERELRLHKSGRLGRGSSIFRAIFQWPTGYGYQPARALLPALAVIACATLIFEAAYRDGQITPAEPHAALAELVTGQNNRLTGADGLTVYEAYDDVPRFNSLLYTIDTFLPLVELDQESSWKPSVTGRQMDQANLRNPPSFWWTYRPVQVTGNFLLRGIDGSIGLNWFRAIIIGLGFMLTTLIAAALSGLFRRDR